MSKAILSIIYKCVCGGDIHGSSKTGRYACKACGSCYQDIPKLICVSGEYRGHEASAEATICDVEDASR